MVDEPTTDVTEQHVEQDLEQPPAEPAVVEDVLVEEVSIDGMCGVY